MPEIPKVAKDLAIKVLGQEKYDTLKNIKNKVLGTIIPTLVINFQKLIGQNSANPPVSNSNTVSPVVTNSNSATVPPITPSNSPQTPENEQILVFTPESFQNGQKVNLKGIPDDKFTGEPKNWQIPFDKLKNGDKIIICSNCGSKNSKVSFGKMEECVLTYIVSKDKKGNEKGEWKITDSKNNSKNFVSDPQFGFSASNDIIRLNGSNLILSKPDLLKDPQLQLNIQYLKPQSTNEEIAQAKQKELEKKRKEQSSIFQELTKGIEYKSGNRLIPHKDAAENATIIRCAVDHFKAQDSRKEERSEIQAQRAEDFERFNKLLEIGQTGINNLTAETTENNFLNSLTNQNTQSPQIATQNQPNQTEPPIYQQYLAANNIGKQSAFVSELAEKMTKEMFPTGRFSDEIINQNPILPNLNDIFGNGLLSVIPQMAVHLSKITLSPKPFNFDQINFAGGWLITDKNNDNPDTGGVLMTVEQILAVGFYQFLNVKIGLKMEEITQETTQAETDRKEQTKNQKKTEFLEKIVQINGKIINHKIKGGMTDEQFEQAKEDFKNRIVKEYTKNPNPQLINLDYLNKLMNLEGLSGLNDNSLPNLGLNFENDIQIQSQKEMLGKIEIACDYAIALENTTKTLQTLTTKFTEVQTKIQEKNPTFDIIQSIINEITSDNNKNAANSLLQNITNNGQIDSQKIAAQKLDLENKNATALTARQESYKFILIRINNIEKTFDEKIAKEKEENEEKAAKLKLYKDTADKIEKLQEKYETNFNIYKLVHLLDKEVQDKIWENVKDKPEIKNKFTKEQAFDTKNTDKIYESGSYYEIYKEMEKVLKEEIKTLESEK